MPASGYQIMPNCPKFSGNLELVSDRTAIATLLQLKNNGGLPVGNHSQKKIGSKAS